MSDAPRDDQDEVPLTEHFIETDLPEPAGGKEADEPIVSLDSSSDERRALGWDDAQAAPTREERSELEDAYDCLGIRTPLEELEGFARARLDALVRANEPDRAELTRAAEAIAREALRHVMSSGQKEAGQ